MEIFKCNGIVIFAIPWFIEIFMITLGDLLGETQSGFINTVGMDMYVEMLHDAIQMKKGIAVQKEEVIKIIEVGKNND